MWLAQASPAQSGSVRKHAGLSPGRMPAMEEFKDLRAVIEKARGIIRTANSEGRDLTDAEALSVDRLTQEAEEGLNTKRSDLLARLRKARE